MCAIDDDSDTFSWKFVQDDAGSVHCVAKTNATFALSSVHGLSVALYSGDAVQQYSHSIFIYTYRRL